MSSLYLGYLCWLFNFHTILMYQRNPLKYKPRALISKRLQAEKNWSRIIQIPRIQVSSIGLEYRLQSWPQVSGIKSSKKYPIPNPCSKLNNCYFLLGSSDDMTSNEHEMRFLVELLTQKSKKIGNLALLKIIFEFATLLSFRKCSLVFIFPFLELILE